MFLMTNRLSTYRRACGKATPVERGALACRPLGQVKLFSSKQEARFARAGIPSRSMGLGGCQMAHLLSGRR